MAFWQTAQTLLLFFGPWLIPKLLAWYRSIKNRPASQITPLPASTSYALTLLFLSSTVAFLSTLPLFAAENIFRATHSRLHTATGVLLTRLAALRPLTAHDEALRGAFDAGGLESRLFYALFGPSVALTCPLAAPGDLDAFRSHLVYAVPSLLAPHVLHLVALGLATSGTLGGRAPARWRTHAVIAALALAAAEVWYVATYDSAGNAASTRANDVDFVYWKMQVYRGLAIAATDAGLGWMMWLQGTGRAFGTLGSPAERLAEHAGRLEAVLAKARGVGVLRNGTVRDGSLRGKVDEYWVKEGEVMKDVAEEAEVLEAQKNALRRMDTTRVARDAEAFIDNVLGLDPSARVEAAS